MHEKSGEFHRKKAVRIALLTLFIAALPVTVGAVFRSGEKNADSTEARVGFIRSLGWEADPETEERHSVTIPSCRESPMADYNELMRQGGYDLSAYEGKTLEQYSYVLREYPNCADRVFLVLYVYRGRVVGGDIHTAALDGFMHELRPRVQGLSLRRSAQGTEPPSEAPSPVFDCPDPTRFRRLTVALQQSADGPEHRS